MTPVYSKEHAQAYIKLPGMLFWTSIFPPDPGHWEGTRIAKRGTIRAKNQIMKDPEVGGFLMDRVNIVWQRINELSPQQRRRIEGAVRGDPDRAVNSRSFEAFLHDERLRQENTFKS
jgi:hypothetical protein